MLDRYKRNIDYLRISITDRCNLKCIYCMPENGIKNVNKNNILSFEEIEKICFIASDIGIKNIKITGGEPLVVDDVSYLIRQIKHIKGIEKVTITTNGILLENHIYNLINSGIDGINISLDTLNKEQYFKITRYKNIENVLNGIKLSLENNIKTKINCVPINNINEDEILDIALLAKKYYLDVRFIELMPIGYGKKFETISNKIIKQKLENHFGNIIASKKVCGSGPANYFNINGFKGNIGFISALSHSFCNSCNRIRISCDGNIKLCLNYDSNFNIKDKIRQGFSNEDLKKYLKNIIFEKPLCHNFYNNNSDNLEFRNMIQIGG